MGRAVTPLFLVGGAELAADRIRLTGSEGHHAAAVRRVHIGERIDLADGFGTLAEGVVSEVGRDWAAVDLVRREHLPEPQPRIVVVQALAKGDHAERAVAMMTEVGVDEIIPWAAGRSVVRWAPGADGRPLGRWRSVAREAGKQAHRPWLPTVRELHTTEQVVDRLTAARLAVLLDRDAPDPLGSLAVPDVGAVVIVVGPEGGLTGEERLRFGSAGARAGRLGPTVLRTSTAGAVGAAVVLAASRRWAGPGSYDAGGGADV